MRTSVACVRCRKSKVKCLNLGVKTTCRACHTSGRDCTYPPPPPTRPEQTAEASQANGGTVNIQNTGEQVRRKHRKKEPAPVLGASKTIISPRALDDALDPELLTPKVWKDLFEIFERHFSLDLPFLHPPTFLEPLNVDVQTQGSEGEDEKDTLPRPQPPGSPLILLALLSLTSRFHARICAHHSPASANRSTDPTIASEYYASALHAQLAGSGGDSLGQPSIERIQSLLMLGLYEWGMCRGVKAWMYVGIAVRMSQAMGLEFEEGLDDEPLALSSAIGGEALQLADLGFDTPGHGSKEIITAETLIKQEIRRRTFWSCFILDRYLSSGKYRPTMINVRDLRIQLPSSDDAFSIGERIHTKRLNEFLQESSQFAGAARMPSLKRARASSDSDGDSYQRAPTSRSRYPPNTVNGTDYEEDSRWEVGPDEALLSHFIKIIEIWGRIARWSCRGGRRNEIHPPWDERSMFYSLRGLLLHFHKTLPRKHAFSAANTKGHLSKRSASPYTLIHTIYFLCLIVLHREYLPFFPIRCSKPQGPLDKPPFQADIYNIPPKWWEDSARDCFKAARDMMDLVRACQKWNALLETPTVGFAIYTAGFVGIYCTNFPHMDTEGYMCSKPVSSNAEAALVINDPNEGSGAAETRRAIEIISHMSSRLRMAKGWIRILTRMHYYFVKMKKDFQRNKSAVLSAGAPELDSDSEAKTGLLTLREGSSGGGLEDYKLLERALRDFGSLEEDDIDLGEGDDANRPSLADELCSTELGNSSSKSDAGDAGVDNGSENSLQRGRTLEVTSARSAWAAINNVITVPAREEPPGHPDGPQVPLSSHKMTSNTPKYPKTGPIIHLPPLFSSSRNDSASAPPYRQTLPPFGTSQNLPLASEENRRHSTVSPNQHAMFPSLSMEQKEHLSVFQITISGEDVAHFVDGTGYEQWNLKGFGAGGKLAGSWLRQLWP
ncbi:MAG: hypothetical protein M1829_004909 [Trizodia sp. TS-e1964]|nr:MAG: hypothetical protein M1829_004909 [Trizodia sp. TS-e1964]